MNKKFLILSLILISIGLVLITSSISRAQTSNEFTISLSDPAKRGKMKAHLNSGSIVVRGTARKDVLVKYVAMDEDEEDRQNDRGSDRRRDGHSQASREGLKRISGGGMDLEATETGNAVVIRSNSWTNELKLEIEIPSGMDVELHTYNDGDLSISNVQGELALSNFNGAIYADDISGSAVASTYNGDIRISFARVTENTPMSYSTFNGDIDLTFPPTFKASLKMKTDRGEILTGFDVKLASKGPVQVKDSKGGVTRVFVDDWKQGDINGGGPEITMKTYNGDILIRKK